MTDINLKFIPGKRLEDYQVYRLGYFSIDEKATAERNRKGGWEKLVYTVDELPRRREQYLEMNFFFLIVAWVGLSGSGKLDFDSFYRVACHFQEEDDEALQKELKEAFRLYDKEGNGYIPTSSLREILAALDDQITPDQMDGMIAEIDTDGSGTVDFDGEYHVSSNYPIPSFACPLTQETLHRESKLCYRYLFRTIEQLKKVR